MVLLHQLDGFSMNTHAGRMGGESLKHLRIANMLRIVSPAAKNDNKENSTCFRQKRTWFLTMNPFVRISVFIAKLS